MPKFSYVAMDQSGKETKGTLEVASQNEAIGRLKEMGFFPTKVVELKGKAKPETKTAKAGGKAGAKGKAKAGAGAKAGTKGKGKKGAKKL